jgi:hypothetical protein
MSELGHIFLSMNQKIKSLMQMLWESEQENKHIKDELEQKDKIIQNLNIDIYFSDLENNELKNLIDRSQDVEYLTSLQNRILEVDKSNQILSEMLPKEFSF